MISSNLKKRSYTSISLLIILFLMFKFEIFLVFILLVTGVISVLEFFKIGKKIFHKKIFALISYFFFLYCITNNIQFNNFL